MKTAKLTLPVLASLLALLCLAPSAWAAFGFSEVDSIFSEEGGAFATQAGSHPYAQTATLALNTVPGPTGALPDGDLKDLVVSLPEGLAGDPTAVPRCASSDFILEACPAASEVGIASVVIFHDGNLTNSPVYSLPAPPGKAMRIGFIPLAGVPVTVDLGVGQTPPYNPTATSLYTSDTVPFYSSEVSVWGRPPGASRPFLTLPRACTGPLATRFEALSWQHPEAAPAVAESLSHDEAGAPQGMTGCAKLAFSPHLAARGTTRAASSAGGLAVDLDVADAGIASPTGLAQSDIREVRLTLPKGMTANPSAANGLTACAPGQIALQSAAAPACPDASKLGSLAVQTPILPDTTLEGALYLAQPYENPFGTLLALYMTIEEPQLGIRIKQPVKIEADPGSGQLVATVSEIPQYPLSHVRMRLREGARGPLISPPSCGEHEAVAVLTPWAGGPDVTSTSQIQISTGPGESPCPQGAAPFHPGFEAGTESNAAGRYSPFLMHLTRADGEQDMGRFSFVLPEGVVPKLAGIPYCSDAAIAGAMARQGAHGGQEEIDNPSCPAASQIGRTVAGAGVGSQLTYVAGKLYLAGPYHGDPISAVAITPAVAGPFDAGVVVVREALRLNPVTHVGEVDGAASEPIPHILKGIPLSLRDLRVYADRPEFTLNATSCEEEQASSTIWGDGTALQPLGETAATLSSRYQAADCAALGFKPKLGLKLKGGTRRGAFPALHAVYSPRKGDANLQRLALTFPKSEFIEQGHFRTICTRVQFAAGAGFGSECPKGSVYGHVKAWSPLLDEPLEGPVYLRSSNHNLPDAVFALHGLVDIEVAVRIDSTHGRLRAIVTDSPDAPVSRAVVDMQGGQKGLFVNSTNLCAGKHRARANAGAQNGRRALLHPQMRALGCAKHRRHRKHTRERAAH